MFNAPLPIVAAPMAGGPTTPALVSAVAEAGGFGFLAGGYKTLTALASEIAETRENTARFGVNLFVPGSRTVDLEAFHRYATELEPEADVYGVHLDAQPVADDDDWTDKLRLLLSDPVPVVSFTFGLPDPAAMSALREAGSCVLATVTTLHEALEAQKAGVDGLVVQGSSAGGHSATFDPVHYSGATVTRDLVGEVTGVIDLPVVAAGGVDGPESVRHLLEAGADAVAVGTLLLLTDEAGTSPTHRSALSNPAFVETVVTRAFTGRPARALRNGFIDRHEATAPNAYPAVHHLTRKLRQAAGSAGDADRLHLWAGTGYRAVREGSAVETVRWLAGGTGNNGFCRET